MKYNQIKTSKYTKFNFVPLNLYHQLAKQTNIFFFVTCILLLIPSISPFNALSYIIGFCTVLVISMVKDGTEDYKRHTYDKELNEKPAFCVKYDINTHSVTIERKFIEDLKTGDFVLVKENEEVPGDMIFISSKMVDENKNIVCIKNCYVETSNLDGELNCKRKIANTINPIIECRVTEIGYGFHICKCDLRYLEKMRSFTVYDTGGALSDFECQVIISNEGIMEYDGNILLRGSILKNTLQVFGLVVATGNATKISYSNLDMTAEPRTSTFEKRISRRIILLFILYFFALVVTSIFSGVFLNRSDIWYLYLDKAPAEYSIQSTITGFLLYNYLIPLSLFVSMEFSRVVRGGMIRHDKKMIKDGINVNCKNINIAEDLGYVKCILADKTGTMTKNQMEFRFFHYFNDAGLINSGEFLKEVCDTLSANITKDLIIESRNILLVMNLLCCNSVDVINGEYQGTSQDEICILTEISKKGIKIKSRFDKGLVLEAFGNEIRVEIPMVLGFSSVRQRMTVIAIIGSKYYLFTKGSDQKLLNDERFLKYKKIIDSHSQYRSLVLCYKEISKEEFLMHENEYESAIYGHKIAEIDKIFEKIEIDLRYIGSTFIEDQLQDNLKETITNLGKANIKFWMVTGDKRETAINCGLSSGLLDVDYEKNENSIVISASILDTNPEFYKTAEKYKSVIIFRASPQNKAHVAEALVKLGIITLSIGDGNNDVLMLRNSHIGVGIKGKEGSQASIAGDITVPEFQSLQRLILIHGRHSLTNLSLMTLNSFNRNVFCISIQFLYGIYTGFSCTPIYGSSFLNYFNLFFTSFVPSSFSIFNRDHDDEYLLAHPEIFDEARKHLSTKKFLLELLFAISQGTVIYFLSHGITYGSEFINSQGFIGGAYALNGFFGLTVFFSVLIRQIRFTNYFVKYTYLAIFASVAMYFISSFFFEKRTIVNTLNLAAIYGNLSFYISAFFVLSVIFFFEVVWDEIIFLISQEKPK